MDEHDLEESIYSARALLDVDDLPRGYFVSVVYDNGNDYSHGISDRSIDNGDALLDSMELLATHINVIAKATGMPPKTVAANALNVAWGQEEL